MRDPKIIQPFGVNWTGDPTFYSKFGLPAHEGVDFKAPHGTEVLACATGKIIRIERETPAGSGAAYGAQIRLEHTHKDGVFETIYAHLDWVPTGFVVGAQVVRGQVIGYSDSTGNSTGDHLHLTLKKRGNTAAGVKQRLGDGSLALYPSDIIDPTPYFPERF